MITNTEKYSVILSTIVAICTISGFIISSVLRKKERLERTNKWLNRIVACNNTIGSIMSNEQMSLFLDNISRVAKGEIELAENPVKLLIDNSIQLKEAVEKLEFNLREREIIYDETVSDYMDDLKSIIARYLQCKDDINVIAQLSETRNTEEIIAISKSADVSNDLRQSIQASLDSNHNTARGDIITDIIGLHFIDGEIPFFEDEVIQLGKRFGETILSTAIRRNSFIRARSSSSQAKYEKAEELLAAGSYEKAFFLFQKASDEGLPEAQFRLGECYEKGLGCEQDDIESFLLFEKAADKGLPIAEYHLGYYYKNGVGCEVDKERAAQYFKDAANKGHLDSMVELGLLLSEGGFNKRGHNLLLRAANRGSIRAQYRIASHYFCHGLYNDSLKWSKKAAENGSPEAMNLYGFLLVKLGYSHSEAFKWIEKAAKEGDIQGQRNLGALYENGCGCDINEEEAANWYEKAAKAGDGDAQFEIARCYYDPVGRIKDRSKAEYYFTQAIQNNILKAYFGLGLLRLDEMKYREAKGYFEIAAEAGYPKAFEKLSVFYRKGLGVEIDLKRADYYKELFEKRSSSNND